MRFHPVSERRTYRASALIAGLALFAALPAQAEWQLAPEQSRVQATIVEITPNGPVPHHHEVRQLQGNVSPDGTLRLPLRLRQTDIMDRLGQLPPWLSGVADTTLATVVTQLPPERLDALAVGESMTETLMLGVQADGQNRREPLEVRFTRESDDTIRVHNAQRVALDGRELMNNQTVRSILLLLGYEEIGDEVPVELDATLVDR
ncbi:hypothetical protein SAMN02745148_00530 [Modicisalibacter ilicicola DSM 19980]|uniref:YceI-like domain-containing protein n=1 Tax=Modicisalibacter ilicicola DSM 19980 TaxID=1121942 RepID=A0A1M4U7L6_9GAMM|nr:hypothetical protein [Halomonas ilicicola]SHE52560.1 hypothetical protein SAMN02745148_00530 [Halomonas ilicicola DSM 19980]